MTVVDSNAPVVNRRVHAREIFTVDHSYYKGLDEKERLSSVTKKPLKLTKKLHWGRCKRLRNAVSMKLRKEKARCYSNQLCQKTGLA